MKTLPLPSLVHYELLLQLLERKSLAIAYEKPALQEQVQRLIVSLRKARAQQKQIEAICDQLHIPFEHYWSLNSVDNPLQAIEDELTSQRISKE